MNYEDLTPTRPPSGKPVDGYGEFMVRVWFTKDGGGEVVIVENPGMPLPFYILGCEHLMRFVASRSGAGFEHALELLHEGAISGKEIKNP